MPAVCSFSPVHALSIQFRLTLCPDWCGWDDSILAIGSELELSSAEIVQIVSANAQLFF